MANDLQSIVGSLGNALTNVGCGLSSIGYSPQTYTYTTNSANLISFGTIPGMYPQQPAQGAKSADHEEIAWLKRRVREIEWRP